ncbi:hypothetical protein SAMN05444163_8141 [Bradyrhizobium ottawaense]|uniref:Uncharacterized protein n=1 Tax=Bradyrhizobium ottawaense TaxID=931866 RepID=A0ABY0QHF3_9BRAD|nr:hypothetical protein SAMN05444163_8141 [Bradyrhizobium ottawaense]
MKSKASPTLYVVWALSKPGPQWRAVCEPRPRAELILVVRDQWVKGRMAVIRPAPIAEAA